MTAPVTQLRKEMHPEARIDEGLRLYMIKVYNYMAGALLTTGAIALFSAQSQPFLDAMYILRDGTIAGMKPLAWIVTFAPLLIVISLSIGFTGMGLATAQACYWLYAGVMGLSMSVIFLTFTGESIARVFFISASMFGATSIYGYISRKDLTGMGSFMFMGLIGIIIASIFNLFLRSSGLQFTLSVLGVIIFMGLTAYDTQRLKALYYQFSSSGEWGGKTAIMGALALYLDFINIFLSLLNLFGERRR